jgi:hypothetical protein
MAAATTPSREAVLPSLGEVVLYHASAADDAAERTAFPLSSHMETFAAIVARVHPAGAVDLMVVDPSKGPMPRWKVPFAFEPRPGDWTLRERPGR